MPDEIPAAETPPAPAASPASPPPTCPPEDDSAEERLFDFTEERRFQLYMERRKGYGQGARESYQRIDQTIVGLSTGAIVFSITFYKEFPHGPGSIWWLLFAWAAFLIATLTALLSLRSSADSDRERITQLDQLAETCEYDEAPATARDRTTAALNNTALVSFVLGIIFMIWFAALNIPNAGAR